MVTISNYLKWLTSNVSSRTVAFIKLLLSVSYEQLNVNNHSL